MDRRTLLAFVLLTLVLILFQVFAPSPPPRQEEPPAALNGAADSPEDARRPDEGTTAAPELRSGIPTDMGAGTSGFSNTLVDSAAVLSPLTVSAGTYRAVLSPRGGVLRSWMLTGYTDALEQPADLVADPQRGLFQIRVLTSQRVIDLSETDFAMTTGERDGVRTAMLRARGTDGLEVELEYAFPEDTYASRVRVRIDGIEDEEGDGRLEMAFPGGISYLERDTRIDLQSTAGVALLGKSYVKHGLGRGDNGWEKVEEGVVQWAGVRSKYFLVAAVPEAAPDGVVRMMRPRGQERIVTTLEVPLSLSGPTEYEFSVFAGPMTVPVLEAQGAELQRAMDLGWRFLRPFTLLLLRFFLAVYEVLPNYGLVIVLLSVLTKVLFYPLTKKSMDSMKQMQLLKPEMDALNEKYKNDPQKRNQAMLEMYKKRKINPAGGCLPLLIQMPVFVALFNVLNTSIELRKEPFALWMTDLSTPDRVGMILGFPIHVLPIIMAVTMLVQQKLTPTDPRQAAMAYLMPIIMTVFFYNMPSGLVLYWTVNNVMSIGQQMWMNRTTQHQLQAA